MTTDLLLELIKGQMTTLLSGEHQLGPREIAALADATIKISKLEVEQNAKADELEQATSGIALFPTMPADVRF
jgi:hypothetical protein